MTIHLQCLIPKKNGYLLWRTNTKEKVARKLKAVAGTWLSTRPFLPQRTILRIRWSQEAQSHSGKQGLLEKDAFNLTISSEVDDHKSGAIVRLK